MRYRSFIISVGVIVCSVQTAFGTLRLPDILSDYMVVQQNDTMHLWGWAEPGNMVDVYVSWNRQASTQVLKDSTWSVAIPTPAGSYTPQTITITETPKKHAYYPLPSIRLQYVLVGEVWLASGQSNMEMPLDGFWQCPVANANREIAQSGDYTGHIRYLTVQHLMAFTPQDQAYGKWQECNPMTTPRWGAVGYFFAQQIEHILHVPVGIINCSWGGTRIEAWMPQELLDAYGDVPTEKDSILAISTEWMRPLVMYNAMLYPLRHYTIKGFLWYQGCSSIGLLDRYTDRQTDLINHWRTLWGRELPFYFVEIAPFRHEQADADWAAVLRAAQWRTMQKVTHCAGVCTNDLVQPYEIDNVHPADKQTVGQRLAWLALHYDYGYTTIAADSPQMTKWEIHDNEIWVWFSHAQDGFSRYTDIQGFEIAGSDQQYVPAQVRANNDDLSCLILSAPSVPHPEHAAYCFRNFSLGNLANLRYLPVVPFRTK